MKSTGKKSKIKQVKRWNQTFKFNPDQSNKIFQFVLANPASDIEPDCTINALAVATNDTWKETYLDMVCHTIITGTCHMSDTVDAVMDYCEARFKGLYTNRSEYFKMVSDYTEEGKSNEIRVLKQDSLINFAKEFAKPDMTYIVVTGVGQRHDAKLYPYGDHITCVINGVIVDRTDQYLNDTVQQFMEIPTKLCNDVKFLYKKRWASVMNNSKT